ncbi:MAG TPA: cation:proton antiporter [Dermatophilaceae bacterium]|nr:cation:proton antiporter [Dermatophilaceae bacterium]
MSFGTLAIIVVVGLIGPMLSLSTRGRVPLVVGELLVGVVLGASGIGALRADQPTFAFFGSLGFALVMFVAGSKVPMRDSALRAGLAAGVGRAVLVGAAAAVAGWAIAGWFETGNGPLYAVLLASSSAALVLPMVAATGAPSGSSPSGSHPPFLVQVAVADVACIVALPLAVDPPGAGRAALGVLAVAAAALLAYAFLRWAETSGWRKRVHRTSQDHEYVLELRVALGLLFTLAAIATAGRVSVMVAGFALGLAVARVGEPKRVAKQMFAITEGFAGPLFFIWLGASLNLHDVLDQPSALALGAVLGVAAVGVHALGVATGQPWSVAVMTCAQLGVPIAAVTVASAAGRLRAGEAAALLLGALVTVAVVTLVARPATEVLGTRPGRT